MQMVEIINNDADKAEMFNKYFCSALGMKQEDVSIPYDVVDGNESLPSVTKKEVRQQLLKLNIFISTALDYFRPKSLKGDKMLNLASLPKCRKWRYQPSSVVL